MRAHVATPRGRGASNAFGARAALALSVVLGLLTGCIANNGSSSSSGGTTTQVSSVGSSTFSGLGVTAQPTSAADAARFLEQSTMGMTEESLAEVEVKGPALYLEEQFAKPASRYTGFTPNFADDDLFICPNFDYHCLLANFTPTPVHLQFYDNALANSDQLRQRVAFAYSQIFVTSAREIRPVHAVAAYGQLLLDNAFVNFRDLLREVTLSPVMATYLNLVNNGKPDPIAGTNPNQNFARELMQLFSIGTVKLNPDGSRVVDAQGVPVPTYDLEVIKATARALTGWTYAPRPGQSVAWGARFNYTQKIIPIEAQHDRTSKVVVDGRVLPAGQTAEQDLEAVLDILFNHPNVGPFIGRQLIQQLVTSNPSPAYIARVTAAFNNNGLGVRGDMKAVLRAVLLDSEARGNFRGGSYGKIKEPVLLATGLGRAFGLRSAGAYLTTWSQNMGQTPFMADTVFGFHQPEVKIAGTDLYAPASTLLTIGAVVGRANFVMTIAHSSGADLSRLEAVASDAPALVSALERKTIGGGVSNEFRSFLTAQISRQPAENRLDRVKTAIYLLGNSSFYQTSR